MATTKATTLAHTLGGISSDISTAEINRLDGLTGDIQTQITALDTAKAPKASPTFTGTITAPNDSISGNAVSGGTIGAGTFTGTIGSSATFPADTIVQVKHKNFTDRLGFNTTSTSRVVMTNFYQDITPKYSNSIILAQAHCSIGFEGTAEWAWFIDAEISSSSSSWVSTGTRTIVGALAQDGNRMQGYHGGPRDNGAANFDDELEGYSNTVAHTPSSTNPIRYQVCFMNLWTNPSYYYINRSANDANNGYATRGTSTLTLYEVKQ